MKANCFVLAAAASFAFTGALGETRKAPYAPEPEKTAMLLCFDVASIKFAVQTCEPAETVVDAAYGLCRSEEKAYEDAIVKGTGATREAVRDGIAEAKRGQLRQTLLGTALKARIDSGHCQGNSD
jgi:hypothetical protein